MRVSEFDLRKGHLVACGLSLALLALVAASPQLLGDQVREGIAGLDQASPVWLWVAGCCFGASLIAVAAAWRAALQSVGARVGLTDASARYGTGSLVNSLAPAKLGTALRLALYTRTLDGEGRVWTVGGIGTAIGAAHSLWLAVLVAIAAYAGVVPLWPLLVLVGALLAAAEQPCSRAGCTPRAVSPTRSTSSVRLAAARGGPPSCSAGRALPWRSVSPRPPR
jgi:uncharacterized membrane protein YbhN (UPF0104 family)